MLGFFSLSDHTVHSVVQWFLTFLSPLPVSPKQAPTSDQLLPGWTCRRPRCCRRSQRKKQAFCITNHLSGSRALAQVCLRERVFGAQPLFHNTSVSRGMPWQQFLRSEVWGQWPAQFNVPIKSSVGSWGNIEVIWEFRNPKSSSKDHKSSLKNVL